MNSELFLKITAYKTAISLVRDMFVKGLISEQEYAQIETILTNKYSISNFSIYR